MTKSIKYNARVAEIEIHSTFDHVKKMKMASGACPGGRNRCSFYYGNPPNYFGPGSDPVRIWLANGAHAEMEGFREENHEFSAPTRFRPGSGPGSDPGSELKPAEET